MKSKENYSGFKGVIKFIVSILSWTALVVLILLAVFLAYYTISTNIYAKRGEKFEPAISLYTIVSPSMSPNINVWDVVISKKVKSPTDIKVGDVITFVSTSSISKGMTITHRVVEITNSESGRAFKTKGDNNLSPDTSPAEFNNVIGKVILRIPQLGRVQDFLGTKGGWLIVIVIPALIIIISDIMKIFKLTGVKKKIEKINKDEEKEKEENHRKEEVRKELIKKRLKIEDFNAFQSDPIPIKKKTRIVSVEGTSISKTSEKTENIKNNRTPKKRTKTKVKNKKKV